MRRLALAIGFLLLWSGIAFGALPTITWKTGKLSVTANKTSGAVVSLAVRLSKPSASVVTCDFLCGGDARSDAEDYGTGKNYTLSTHTVTIPAGALVPNTQPTLTVYNNPIYDIDRTAVISLTNPANARVRSADKLQVKIVDNGVNRVYKDAVVDGGLDNTGASDCTADLASLIATVQGLQSSDVNGGKYGGVIYFPPGTYRFDSTMNTLAAGITYVGAGNSTKIQGNVAATTRVWSSGSWGVGYPGYASEDSYPIVIKTMAMDGGFSAYSDHADIVFMMQGIITYPYKLRSIFDTLTFSHGGYSAIYAYQNCDVSVYKCNWVNWVPDSGYMPYGVVVGGGFTKCVLRNCTVESADIYFDREPMGDSQGYGNTFGSYIEIYNTNMAMNLVGNSADWTFNAVDFHTFKARNSPLGYLQYLTNTNIDIDDSCTLSRNNGDSRWDRDTYSYVGTGGNYGTVANSTFTAYKGVAGSNAWNPYACLVVGVKAGETFTLDTCTFVLDVAFSRGDWVFGVYCGVGDTTGSTVIQDCIFQTTAAEAAVWVYGNRACTIAGSTLTGKYAIMTGVYGDPAASNITIGAGNTYNSDRFIEIACDATHICGLTFNSVIVPQASNYIKFIQGSPAYVNTNGTHRTITGTGDPNTVVGGNPAHGFVDDVYNYGGHVWHCDTAGYENINGVQVYGHWTQDS